MAKRGLFIPIDVDSDAAVARLRAMDAELRKLATEAQKQADEANKAVKYVFTEAELSARKSEQAVQEALRKLGVRSDQLVEKQKAGYRAAFEALKSSGALSAGELARATESFHAQIKRLDESIKAPAAGLRKMGEDGKAAFGHLTEAATSFGGLLGKVFAFEAAFAALRGIRELLTAPLNVANSTASESLEISRLAQQSNSSPALVATFRDEANKQGLEEEVADAPIKRVGRDLSTETERDTELATLVSKSGASTKDANGSLLRGLALAHSVAQRIGQLQQQLLRGPLKGADVGAANALRELGLGPETTPLVGDASLLTTVVRTLGARYGEGSPLEGELRTYDASLREEASQPVLRYPNSAFAGARTVEIPLAASLLGFTAQANIGGSSRLELGVSPETLLQNFRTYFGERGDDYFRNYTSKDGGFDPSKLTKEQLEQLERGLGVRRGFLSSGAVLSNDEFQGIIADRASTLTEPERVQLYDKLAGNKQGQLLSSIAPRSSKALEEGKEDVIKRGLAPSTDRVRSSKELKAAQNELDDSIKSIKLAIGDDLIPIFTQLAKALAALADAAAPGLKAISQVFSQRILQPAVKDLKGLSEEDQTKAVSKFFDDLPRRFSEFIDLLRQILLDLRAFAKDIHEIVDFFGDDEQNRSLVGSFGHYAVHGGAVGAAVRGLESNPDAMRSLVATSSFGGVPTSTAELEFLTGIASSGFGAAPDVSFLNDNNRFSAVDLLGGQADAQARTPVNVTIDDVTYPLFGSDDAVDAFTRGVRRRNVTIATRPPRRDSQ